MVCARRPSLRAASIWLRISASSGETINVGPAARAAFPQQRGRHEVHRRLAPAGPLHAEDARTILDEIAHRVELVLAELRLRTGECLKVLLGAGVDGGAHVLSTVGDGAADRPRVHTYDTVSAQVWRRLTLA